MTRSLQVERLRIYSFGT